MFGWEEWVLEGEEVLVVYILKKEWDRHGEGLKGRIIRHLDGQEHHTDKASIGV